MAFTVFQSWLLTVLSKCIANTSAALAEKNIGDTDTKLYYGS